MTKRSDFSSQELTTLTSGDGLAFANPPEVIFQTDLNFNFTGWNSAIWLPGGISQYIGKNLFEFISIEFADSDIESFKKELKEKNIWQGKLIYHLRDGKKFVFLTTASYLYNKENEKNAVVFFNQSLGSQNNTELKLAETEATYEKLLNTLVDGVLMIGKDYRVSAFNKRAAEILNFKDEELLGRSLELRTLKIVKTDYSDFPFSEFPAVVSLQTGFPQRNVKMGLYQANGILRWIAINSEAMIRSGEFEPYAVVISLSDITEMVTKEDELRKSNERFYYVSKITTDAIWDLDLLTNEIYRSDAFRELSGYAEHEIKSDLQWWFNKIHPDDRERVKTNLNENLLNKEDRWEDEYSFLCADGEYKILTEIGVIHYRNETPVRILGTIRDSTEKKKLERHLFEEQEQKRKAIEQATISAQEKERGEISNELHDNVNQILMSSKLCLDAAKQNLEEGKPLFERAIEYQNLAIEEIRKLSHKLSSSVIKVIGLRKSINEVVGNLNSLHHLKVNFDFDEQLENVLSYEQKLMIYRIVQEQSNNIIKHAKANVASISLIEKDDEVLLEIADNGKGFEKGKQPNGIGFINIFSRVEAFGGSSSLKSSPEKGCILNIRFPV